VAVNCCVPLGATVGFEGETVMETRATTVRVVEPLILPEEAVIVVVPPPTPVARPDVLMLATVVMEDSQLAVAVRFLVVPSL